MENPWKLVGKSFVAQGPFIELRKILSKTDVGLIFYTGRKASKSPTVRWATLSKIFFFIM